MKSIYARKQVELFLDEKERSIEEESEQEEDKIEGDGNNTPTQRKIDLYIGMIGAREETLGKTRSQTQEICHHLRMNPWKEQTLQWRIGFKKPA